MTWYSPPTLEKSIVNSLLSCMGFYHACVRTNVRGSPSLFKMLLTEEILCRLRRFPLSAIVTAPQAGGRVHVESPRERPARGCRKPSLLLSERDRVASLGGPNGLGVMYVCLLVHVSFYYHDAIFFSGEKQTS